MTQQQVDVETSIVIEHGDDDNPNGGRLSIDSVDGAEEKRDSAERINVVELTLIDRGLERKAAVNVMHSMEEKVQSAAEVVDSTNEALTDSSTISTASNGPGSPRSAIGGGEEEMAVCPVSISRALYLYLERSLSTKH